MLFSWLATSWWDSKPGRCCQLHHIQTLYNWALGWICLNLFYKVNFLRKTKRCFNFRKSDSTKQPPVTKSTRKKGEGCTKHGPLAHCVLAGWVLVLTAQFDFNKLPDFLSCSNLCVDTQYPGWFWPPKLRIGAPGPHRVFPAPLCPPTLQPKGCSPVLHGKEQPPSSLHMASPTFSYERDSL